MKAEAYHQSLAPLEEACRLAGWVCLTCPLTGGRLMILLRHSALVSKVWKWVGRDRRARRFILVREFSTLPLLLVFPLLWPLRKRIRFLINHNLQWAARSSAERFGLRMLARLGAQWALFETQDFPNLGKFGISSDRNLVLPHPALKSPAAEGCPKGGAGSPVVGVAGYYRPEKNMDELVRLLKDRLPEFGILLGIPNPEDAAHLDVETVSTASKEDYFKMIARCDVLVFNYSRDGYFYRASGPLADAAACGTAVVVPDFPIIGKQADGIGEVFQTLDELPRAVECAVEKARAGQYDFDGYCRVRSVEALAGRLRSV
jgi:glycosyltransferase involved in cell wall biosynthesis